MKKKNIIVVGEYRIEYCPKPVPTRGHDWDWYHEDYQGPGDNRCGTASGVSQAVTAINQQIEEESTNEDPPDPSDWDQQHGQPNSYYG